MSDGLNLHIQKYANIGNSSKEFKEPLLPKKTQEQGYPMNQPQIQENPQYYYQNAALDTTPWYKDLMNNKLYLSFSIGTILIFILILYVLYVYR